VGLVVSFQLLQAGCEVAAIVDAAPRIGGYGVHAAKVARCGVPFFLSHTILQAEGDDGVTGVTIGEVDGNWNTIAGTEKHFDVDAICLAVGLSPMSQLLQMAGCEMEDHPKFGGLVPTCDAYGTTSVPGLFAAGDVSGIEEASSAMIQGRIAGAAAALRLGYFSENEFVLRAEELERALSSLRQGMFAPENKGKKLSATEEGCPVSEHLLRTGFLTEDEIFRYPGVKKIKGIHPVIECSQNIPCNPCQDACARKCIKVGERITSLPVVDEEVSCSGCGMCVAACSGQCIFLVDEEFEEDYATVVIPYEFLPLPRAGEKGIALDRSGKELCDAEVVGVKSLTAFDKTSLLTIKVSKEMSMRARFYKKGVRVG
ncbi:MAG: FAD-dependent pyridine nucleotide-disulfide oxidoreductase, partial [Bacillota bacterium]|nr:FAD-dependent pyridine nucleotide-disulfide oxidoreductase [Bacillota bacterium]